MTLATVPTGQANAEPIRFTVDSKLLRELGARLVGRPHIALAELIKNSYDADATVVQVEVTSDSIVISDNGHGMTRKDFVDRWMRIGTATKESEKVSKRLHRPLTGSKGVGRLSVQLLAERLDLVTRTSEADSETVQASVDWSAAIDVGLLTEATALVSTDRSMPTFPGRTDHGTVITLTGLQQEWNGHSLSELAREIWPLQPPFDNHGTSDADSFKIQLTTGDEEQDRNFASQMSAVLGLWTARIVGRTLPAGDPEPANTYAVNAPRAESDGDDDDSSPGPEKSDVSQAFLQSPPPDLQGETRIVKLLLETADGRKEVVHYKLGNCALDRVRFQIRVFNFRNRQPHGISVAEARRYLNRFGGVHVYDAGFHLPYYGSETDWLRVEFDHSHRLSQSALLPASLVHAGGEVLNPLQYLPTNSRLFGAVQVDTSREQRVAAQRGQAARREALSIQVTRDRLADTEAYRSLIRITRFAIDLYAIREAQRAWAAKLNPSPNAAKPSGDSDATSTEARDQTSSRTLEVAADRADIVREMLEATGDLLPEQTREALKSEVADIAQSVRREAESSQARLGLLGALATAGISTLAYEHEAARQNALLCTLVKRLRRAEPDSGEVAAVADAIDDVLDRAAATRRLFSHLLDERSRSSRGTFLAGEVVTTVVSQVGQLMRGVVFDISGLPEALRLPPGGYAEWVAILQNVLLNAYNAMLDCDERIIMIDGGSDRGQAWLRVQDTGSGVDLSQAEQLFAPFERRSDISEDRRNLGLGGTGLGLTIVRMLATDAHARATFEPPDAGYSTAFVLRWSTS